MHRRASNSGYSVDARTLPNEVLNPRIAPGVKQGDNISGQRVDPSQVWPLAQIAAVAGQGEVSGIVGPAMLLRDDMLDVVTQFRVLLLEQTVLAAVVGTPPNKLPRRNVHVLFG